MESLVGDEALLGVGRGSEFTTQEAEGDVVGGGVAGAAGVADGDGEVVEGTGCFVGVAAAGGEEGGYAEVGVVEGLGEGGGKVGVVETRGEWLEVDLVGAEER